jgi:hypothetical protein
MMIIPWYNNFVKKSKALENDDIHTPFHTNFITF